MTPFAGFSAAGGESRTWRAGARWTAAAGAALALEAERSESGASDPQHGIALRLDLRW